MPDLLAALDRLRGWRRALAAIGLGLLAALALPPVHAIALLWLALPGLVRLIDGAPSKRSAFLAGWWFGFGQFSASLYWIAYALLVDPLKFGWLIPIAVFGLSGLLAAFIGLPALLAAMLAPAGVGRVLVLAAFWTFFEWVRSWLFTGFPWNLTGSVWVAVPPVLQGAALFGVYGLSLATVLAASLPAAWRRPGGKVAAPIGLAMLLLLAGWGYVRIPAGPAPLVEGVGLRLVQANIAQTLKWKPEMREQHLYAHLALTERPGKGPISAVIWPETAAPSFLDQDDDLRRRIAEALPAGALLITGVARGTEPGVRPFRIWNSVEVYDDRGVLLATYDKAHLVPFGEYVPLRGLLPLAKITAGGVDFSAGPGPATLALPGLPPAGPLICYEVIFPAAVVDEAHRPGWLVNVTNDGWFGISAGPHQHLAAVVLRAVEEGLPVARAANTGISAVIDPYGRLIGSLPLGESGVLDAPLPKALPGPTLYARLGNSVPALLAFLVLGLGLVWRRLF